MYRIRPVSLAFVLGLSAGCYFDTTIEDGGAGAGPSCAEYCTTITEACPDEYLGLADCVEYCENAQWPTGQYEDEAGNSIACRLYHGTVALQAPVLHCPHAGKSGGDVCGSWCDNLCQLSVDICGPVAPVHDSVEQCLEECATIDASGRPGDTTGDTVQCRIYHAGTAALSEASAQTHCGHIAVPSTECFDEPPCNACFEECRFNETCLQRCAARDTECLSCLAPFRDCAEDNGGDDCNGLVCECVADCSTF